MKEVTIKRQYARRVCGHCGKVFRPTRLDINSMWVMEGTCYDCFEEQGRLEIMTQFLQDKILEQQIISDTIALYDEYRAYHHLNNFKGKVSIHNTLDKLGWVEPIRFYPRNIVMRCHCCGNVYEVNNNSDLFCQHCYFLRVGSLRHVS